MRNSPRLGVLAVILLLAWPGRASAQGAERAYVDPPPEVGLAVEQLALGTVSAVFAGAGAAGMALSEHTAGYEISAGLMATAVLPGVAVCALGGDSPWYDGSCAGPIAGAYLGVAAVGFPVAFAVRGWTYQDSDGGNFVSPSAALVTLAAAAVGSALGATIGWHAMKHRRRSAPNVARAEPPPVPRAPWPEMPSRQLPQAPGSVEIPVLAFTF